MTYSQEGWDALSKSPDYGRLYEIYASISRTVYHREPITFERWMAIDRRSYFRTVTDIHDDGQFDTEKDRQGDAQ